MPRNEQVSPGVVVWFQKNGWMDSSLMLKYIDYFNDIRAKNGTRRNPEMLVYDLFKGHLEGSTTFAKNGIPGWQVAAGETATGNLRRARLNSTDLNAELEISDDDNGNNVDDNDEGSDDASDNGSDDNTHNSIHDSDDSEDVSDRMRQLTV
uniref:DDE-1 domain-containing protein n=1 Tax=Rhizophagus irregularis (strain DAOM 181602 / DAOM 197198 / MUCL 43194) TaxID=747089 RepID=U9U810_RHIID